MAHQHPLFEYYFRDRNGSSPESTYVTWNIEGTLLPKIVFWVDFSHHWHLFVMNADGKFAALDWNYASVQDTAGHSELESIDGDFPTFEIDQNKPTDLGPPTTKALILQAPV